MMFNPADNEENVVNNYYKALNEITELIVYINEKYPNDATTTLIFKLLQLIIQNNLIWLSRYKKISESFRFIYEDVNSLATKINKLPNLNNKQKKDVDDLMTKFDTKLFSLTKDVNYIRSILEMENRQLKKMK